MDRGAVGGGAPALFDQNEVIPLYGRFLSLFIVIGSKLVGFLIGRRRLVPLSGLKRIEAEGRIPARTAGATNG